MNTYKKTRRSSIENTTIIATIALLVASLGFMATANMSYAQNTGNDTRMVWLTTRSSSAQETFANANLDSGDLIVYHFGAGRDPTSSELQDLNDVTSVPDGRKGLEFFSLAEIQEHAPTVAAQGFGFISYDLESGASPSAEVSDPIGSFQAAKAAADAAGIDLMAAPSHAISTNNADDIADLVDRYHLQSQPKQDDDTTCAIMDSWVDARVADIEGANSELAGEITYQVTLTGNAASGKTAYETAEDCIDRVSPGSEDGVTIFWNGATWDSGQFEQLTDYFEANYS
jgi:hypothetical protein